MKYTNNIYLNGAHINTIETTKIEAIFKELFVALVVYGCRPIYDHIKQTLICRYSFTRTNADGSILKYVYNIVFEGLCEETLTELVNNATTPKKIYFKAERECGYSLQLVADLNNKKVESGYCLTRETQHALKSKKDLKQLEADFIASGFVKVEE